MWVRSRSFVILFILTSSVLALIPCGAAGSASTDSRIVVLSNETNILIAHGNLDSGLDMFPASWENRRAMEVTCQLVDGNYTPIWQDHLANRGIGDMPVHWSIDGDGGTITTDQDGFLSILIVPDTDGPETLVLELVFDGYTDPNYGVELFPPVTERYSLRVLGRSGLDVHVSQDDPLAGTTILVTGTFRDVSGAGVPDEGLVATLDGKQTQENTRMGIYIDDVSVGDAYHWDFSDGDAGWTHYGSGDEWEVGAIPDGALDDWVGAPDCAGTDLDGAYGYASKSWLQGPALDLSEMDEWTVGFDIWADVHEGDDVLVQFSTDGGGTWPVSRTLDVSGDMGEWAHREIVVGTAEASAYGTIAVAGQEDVMVRFGLSSRILPVLTAQDGSFEMEVDVPGNAQVGTHVLKLRHPVSDDHMEASATVHLLVRRTTNIEFDGAMELFGGEPMEVRARIVDTAGNDLATVIDGALQDYEVLTYYSDPRRDELVLNPIQRVPVTDGSNIVFAFEPPSDLDLGPINIHAHFLGTEHYLPVASTGSGSMRAHTEIGLTSPLRAEQWVVEEMTIGGRLSVLRRESKDMSAGDPVAGRTVEVRISGELAATVLTDANGDFMALASGITEESLGSTTMEVSFGGDPVYAAASMSVDLSLFQRTQIPYVADVTVDRGQEAVLGGLLLTESHGDPIPDADMVLEMDGRTVAIGRTNDEGAFSLAFRPGNDLEVGRYSLDVIYRGDTRYLMSDHRVTMTIMADTRIMMEAPPAAHWGDTIEVKGVLYENMVNGWRPLTGETLAIVDEGESVRTDALGRFSLLRRLDKEERDIRPPSFELIHISNHRHPSTAAVNITVLAEPWFELISITEEPGLDRPVTLTFRVHEVDSLRAYVHVSDGRSMNASFIRNGGAFSVSFTPEEPGTYDVIIWNEANATMEASSSMFDVYIAPESPLPVDLGPDPDEGVLVTVSGITLLLALFLSTGQSAKFMMFKVLLVPLYSKIRKDEVLDHFIRGQIFGLIRMHPGAHYNLIKKKLDLRNGVLAYHLTILEREGYVISEKDGMYKRFFPNHMKFEVDYPFILSRIQEKIMDWIRVNPGRSQKECARALEMSTSTVNDNVIALRDYKLVELRKDGKRSKLFMIEEPAPDFA